MSVQNPTIETIISTYNRTWIGSGCAWLVKTGEGFTVSKKLDAPWLSSTPTQEAVEKAVNEAIAFLIENGKDLHDGMPAHRDFLGRLRESFTQEKCGHQQLLRINDLDRAITKVRDTHLLPTNEIKEPSIHAKYTEYENRLKTDQFPFDPSDYSTCDIIFVIGEKQFAIPAHREVLTKSHPRWIDRLPSTKNGRIMTLEKEDVDAFCHLLKAIYQKKLSLFLP